MQLKNILTGVALLAAAANVQALDKPLNVEKQITNNCEAEKQTKPGDKIWVHYRGTLESDGSQFEASYDRGQPLSFTVGQGQVIKGWDQGLLGMCAGDKRKLTIQPEWAYGSRAMDSAIPANSVLVFETELMSIGTAPAKQEL